MPTESLIQRGRRVIIRHKTSFRAEAALALTHTAPIFSRRPQRTASAVHP